MDRSSGDLPDKWTGVPVCTAYQPRSQDLVSGWAKDLVGGPIIVMDKFWLTGGGLIPDTSRRGEPPKAASETPEASQSSRRRRREGVGFEEGDVPPPQEFF